MFLASLYAGFVDQADPNPNYIQSRSVVKQNLLIYPSKYCLSINDLDSFNHDFSQLIKHPKCIEREPNISLLMILH